jgi:hypothetical protein
VEALHSTCHEADTYQHRFTSIKLTVRPVRPTIVRVHMAFFKGSSTSSTSSHVGIRTLSFESRLTSKDQAFTGLSHEFAEKARSARGAARDSSELVKTARELLSSTLKQITIDNQLFQQGSCLPRSETLVELRRLCDAVPDLRQVFKNELLALEGSIPALSSWLCHVLSAIEHGAYTPDGCVLQLLDDLSGALCFPEYLLEDLFSRKTWASKIKIIWFFGLEHGHVTLGLPLMLRHGYISPIDFMAVIGGSYYDVVEICMCQLELTARSTGRGLDLVALQSLAICIRQVAMQDDVLFCLGRREGIKRLLAVIATIAQSTSQNSIYNSQILGKPLTATMALLPVVVKLAKLGPFYLNDALENDILYTAASVAEFWRWGEEFRRCWQADELRNETAVLFQLLCKHLYHRRSFCHIKKAIGRLLSREAALMKRLLSISCPFSMAWKQLLAVFEVAQNFWKEIRARGHIRSCDNDGVSRIDLFTIPISIIVSV